MEKDIFPLVFPKFFHPPQSNDVVDENSTLFYFTKLKYEVSWQRLQWDDGDSFPRSVFRYTNFERHINKCSVLEKLLDHVHERFQTDILKIWCDMYLDINDFSSGLKDSLGSHVFILSLGGPREHRLYDSENKKDEIYTLGDGDGIYFEANKYVRYISPAHDENITITFFTKRPLL